MKSEDLCCRVCRTPYAGVCTQNHSCWCHVSSRARERAEDQDNSSRSPRPDPTGNTAVNRAMKAQKRRFPRPGRRRF